MWIAALSTGLAVGGAAAWFVARARAAAEMATLQAALDHARTMGAERLELVQRTQAEFEERFKALTAEALAKNNTSFFELAQTQLGPIKETLHQFGEQTNRLEQNRRQAYGALFQQVQALTEGQEKLRAETGNLVSALRKPHFAGSWGQMKLKRVLEMAGMVNHCDFVEQATTRTADEGLLR